jgi:ribosomal protein L12E/L44/L45/RPP1/RPP2
MTASNPITEVCSNAVSAITQFFTPTVSAESKQPSENEEEQQEGEGGGEEEEGEKEEEEEEDEPEDVSGVIHMLKWLIHGTDYILIPWRT